MTIPAGTRLGAYEVVSPLGAGGMGEVYRARDSRLGREVALKVLPEDVSRVSDRLARFEQEARAASALNHPNIVTIYEIGEAAGSPFIAMELIDGRTLREIVAEGPLPLKRVLSIGAQAADGLARAHAAGIVHRDLKPENLMVSKDGYVKILDFGLSKLVAPESGEVSAMPTLARPETHPGTVLGTVAYMSPEQASGEAVDFRSDQFSFGSILYEAVTGEKAFSRKTAAETMSAIIREDPEPIAKARPETPLPLKWIVERCLAKDPEERYASTRDLARDLASVRDHISEVTSGAEAIAPVRLRGRPRLFFPALAAAGLVLLGVVLHALLAPGDGRKAAASAPSFHRLTFRSGEIQNARFASDGQTILYGGTWDGEPARLYLARPESPESRPFDFGSDAADILAVSSSGEMAILLNQGPPLAGGLLARVPMAGGVPRKVLEGVTYAGADWAPNGKDLIIAHASGGTTRLELPIGNTILNGQVCCPRFSPAGDRIAFFGENGEVAIIDRAGKSRTTLSSGWARLTGAPCWRSDGQEIWFTAAETGQMAGLWAVDLQGKRRLVTRVPGDLELDDLSRDGRVLVAHHTIFRIQAGLAPGEQTERDLSWLDGSYPADLSPDGKTLLFNETAEGGGSAPSVYLRKTDGSPPVRLGEGTGIALSPDGNWVLASTNASPGNPAQLVLLPTGPGQTRALKSGGFESFGAGAWLADGKRIIFSAAQAGHRSRLYVQDLSGEPKAISPEGIQSAPTMLSPDGRFAVGMERPGVGSLYPLDGGEARPIAGLEGQPIAWSADGSSLYAHRVFEIPNKVWLLDLASGQKRPWLEIKPREPALLLVFPLLMSRDGKSYVYGSRRVHSALYIVDGLR